MRPWRFLEVVVARWAIRLMRVRQNPLFMVLILPVRLDAALLHVDSTVTFRQLGPVCSGLGGGALSGGSMLLTLSRLCCCRCPLSCHYRVMKQNILVSASLGKYAMCFSMAFLSFEDKGLAGPLALEELVLVFLIRPLCHQLVGPEGPLSL